jgi:hypothetical protein
MSNPYKNFEKDPFEIARLINLCGASFEAFKKIACAGISGRKKSKQTDLKEAIYTVKRIISDIEAGAIFHPTPTPNQTIPEIVEIYSADKCRNQKAALIMLLTAHFTNYQSTSYLTACIECLEKLIAKDNEQTDDNGRII